MAESIITPAIAEELVRLWNLGWPTKKIAAELRIGEGALEHFCSRNRDRCPRRNGFGRQRTWVPIGPRPGAPAIPDKAALQAEIIRLYPTTTAIEIAEQLGCTEYDVRRAVQRCGVTKAYNSTRSAERRAAEALYRARTRNGTIDCSAHLAEMDAAADSSDALLDALIANHPYGCGELNIKSSGNARYIPTLGRERSYVGSSADMCAVSTERL